MESAYDYFYICFSQTIFWIIFQVDSLYDQTFQCLLFVFSLCKCYCQHIREHFEVWRWTFLLIYLKQKCVFLIQLIKYRYIVPLSYILGWSIRVFLKKVTNSNTISNKKFIILTFPLSAIYYVHHEKRKETKTK